MRYRLQLYDRSNSKLFDYVTTKLNLQTIGMPISSNLITGGLYKKDIFVKAYCSAYDSNITLTEKEKFIVEMSDFDVEFSKEAE